MDPKKLRKQYLQIAHQLKETLEHVQSQLRDLPPSDFDFDSGVKSYASMKRKMEQQGIKNPLELSDLIRGRIFFSDQFQHEDVLDILSKLFGSNIKNIDKNTRRSPEHGLEYHGIHHVDLHFNGINFELQVIPMEFKPFKPFLHLIYEKLRNPKTSNKLSDKQKALLSKIHNNLYKKLHQQAKDNRSN